MLSYKEYKELNENLNSPFTLGVKPVQSISQLQSKWDEMGMSMKMPLMKKKSKKFMNDQLPGDHELEEPDDMVPPLDGDEEFEDDDLDSDVDDEDEEESDEEDFEDGDEEFEDEDELSDDGGDIEEKMVKKKKPMKPQMDLGMGAMGGMGGPKMMKKESKKHEDEDDDDVEDLDLDVDVEDDDDDDDVHVHDKNCGCSSCGKCMKKKSKKHMHKGKKHVKEHQEFFNKLKQQCGLSFFEINPDGTFKEDAIIPPHDVNKGLTNDEPQAGEVGYAPQGKLGAELGVGSFAEWTTKHKRNLKNKINKKR